MEIIFPVITHFCMPMLRSATNSIEIGALKEQYRLEGYSNEWIKVRVESITTRNELTDEWGKRGIVLGLQYGSLTNEIHKGTFDGLTVQSHKDLKQVEKSENLRDHMTTYELAFSTLGEALARDKSREAEEAGYDKNKEIAEMAGRAAGVARKAFEEEAGMKVITDKSPKKEAQKRLSDDKKYLTESEE